MNDYDKIVDVLASHEVTNDKLALDLLKLYISVAGEKFREIEGAKYKLLEALLTNQAIKPEHNKVVYKLMSESKEKYNGGK